MYRHGSHDFVRSAQDFCGRPDAAVKFNSNTIGPFIFNGTVNVSNSVQANSSSEPFDHVEDAARPCAKGSCDDWDCEKCAFVALWDDGKESNVFSQSAPVQAASARAILAKVAFARAATAQVAPRQIHVSAKPAKSFARMAGRVALATLVGVVAMVAFARLSAAAGLDLAHCLGITAQTASAAGLF